MPETLETIATSIRDVRTSLDGLRTAMDAQFANVDARFANVDARFEQVDARFAKVDTRFDEVGAQFAKVDTRFDELKAQLRTEIESVRGDVKLVAEGFAAQAERNARNDADHKRFKTRLDKHGDRIFALEAKTPKAPGG